MQVPQLLVAASIQLDNLDHHLQADSRDGFREGVEAIDRLMERDVEIATVGDTELYGELKKWVTGFRHLAQSYLSGELLASRAREHL